MARDGCWSGGSVAAMSSAELLDRIEEAAVNGDVVEALLLCQTLAGDADSIELQEWATHELEGYPEGEPPPAYRQVPGQLFVSGATPLAQFSVVTIPLEILPEPERTVYEQGVPLLHSISEIVERAAEDRVRVRPGTPTRMLQAVNSAHDAPPMFDDIYFRVTGPAFGTVVTAVRSQIVKRAAQLRQSLPADERPDSAAGTPVASEVATGSVVNITGDHNQIAMGTGRDVQQRAALGGRSNGGPMHRIWRWVKRILEAVTVFGAAVGFVGGGSFNPF